MTSDNSESQIWLFRSQKYDYHILSSRSNIAFEIQLKIQYLRLYYSAVQLLS